MIEKYFDLSSDDPRWGRSYQPIHGTTMEKLAKECHTPDALLQKMADIKPREDGRYVLLNAMGAGEYWSINRNGDYFAEWSLKGEDPPKDVVDTLSKHAAHVPNQGRKEKGEYGYETFLKYAHVFRGHRNTDPVHKVGDVVAAAYNDKMKRVELITFIDKTAAPDVVQRIDNGEPVAFSMGAKLSADRCSICNNCARTRAEYCEHLQTKLGQVLEGGRLVFAYNDFPRFFDISEVNRPADRSAWMLKKVAFVQELVATPPEAIDKESTIVKNIPAETTQDPKQETSPELLAFVKKQVKKDMARRDRTKIAHLDFFEPEAFIHTATALGIVLTPEEVVKLSSEGLGSIPSEFDPSLVDRRIVSHLTSYTKDRSLQDPHFTKRAARRTELVDGGEFAAASAAFDKYATYLKSLDFNKLAAWVDDSVMIRMAVSPEQQFLKVAGVGGSSRSTWLPFVIGISML